jgi:sugar lactone lactonase YvrE
VKSLRFHRYQTASIFSVVMVASLVAKADLFVVDSDSVYRYDATSGAVIQTNGQNAFTTFVGATGVKIGPDGLVYVDSSNPGFDPNLAVINRYNATTGQQVGGAFVPFANDASQLSNAQGMAFGPGGNLYVADLGDNGPVKSFSSTGVYGATYATTGGNAQAVAFSPADPSDLYTATGSTIEQINLVTHADSVIIQGQDNPNPTFDDATDLAFGPDGKLYVLDISNNRGPEILTYNSDGTDQQVFTNFAISGFQPAGMAFGPDGLLYVSGIDELNTGEGEILRLNSRGTPSIFVDNLTAPGFLAFSNVPEPGGVVVLCGAIGLLRRRRGVGGRTC